MDNQHEKITGYRDLSEGEIAAMNNVKEIANMVGEVVKALEATPSLDQFWVANGKQQLQNGFMALTRSIAQPTSF